MNERKFWSFLAVLCALAAASGLTSCGENKYQPPPPPQVTVSAPIQENVTDYLEFTGNTAAINTVKLCARVEGYLDKVYFNDGDYVKKDQPLFLIQQNTYQAQLAEAEADVLAQKAILLHAQTEYDRYADLAKKAAAAQTDVDKWHYERDAAQASVQAAEAKRDLAKLNLDYTAVNAPFDGRVDRRLKDPGNLVGESGDTDVVVINQVDPLYVYFTISETDLLRVREGHQHPKDSSPKDWKRPLSFGLANEEGYPHEGYLDFAAITIDPDTGTLLLRGVFPNPDGKILAGLFARVRASQGEPKPALLVPEAAIAYDQEGSYVYVVDDKNTVQRRAVELGAQHGELHVVKQGLTEQDSVVVDGLLRAIPGRVVTPMRVPQAAKAAAPETASVSGSGTAAP